MTDEMRLLPDSLCTCQTGAPSRLPAAAPAPSTGWRVRVLMQDPASGQPLVLAQTEHQVEGEAALAAEWFPAIAHYSVFSLQILRGEAEQSLHPICGVAFASKLGKSLDVLLAMARRRPAPRLPAEAEGRRTLQ